MACTIRTTAFNSLKLFCWFFGFFSLPPYKAKVQKYTNVFVCIILFLYWDIDLGVNLWTACELLLWLYVNPLLLSYFCSLCLVFRRHLTSYMIWSLGANYLNGKYPMAICQLFLFRLGSKNYCFKGVGTSCKKWW